MARLCTCTAECAAAGFLTSCVTSSPVSVAVTRECSCAGCHATHVGFEGSAATSEKIHAS